MSNSHTKIIALLSITFFAVCSSAAFFFIKKVDDQKIEYTNHVSAQSQMLERERSLDELVRTLGATKVERESLSSRILEDDNIIDFLELIETLGKEQHVAILKNGLKVDPIDETFEAISMHIDISGTYTQMMYLLTIFEHLPYQVSFSEISLAKNQGDTDDTWRLAFDIHVTKFKKI